MSPSNPSNTEIRGKCIHSLINSTARRHEEMLKKQVREERLARVSVLIGFFLSCCIVAAVVLALVVMFS